MTDYRAPTDPYTVSFETRVTAVNGHDVELDTTYFYAEGGGQPPDRGTINSTTVTDVRKRDSEVVHTLSDRPPFGVGDTVACSVDPEFRRYCMRLHTASHALYGAGRRLLADVGYGGFGIDEDKARIDFETSTQIDDGVLIEMERLVDRIVWESRDVSWETVPRAGALDMGDIAFNAKTEEGITGETVRVVTIEAPSASTSDQPWDVAACGGTHVANTNEIGPVTVLDRSNPGEGLTRVELAVGPPAIERRAQRRRALSDAATATGTAPSDLPREIERLQTTITDLEDDIHRLESQVIEARLEEVQDNVIEKDGDRWVVGDLTGIDANTLGDHAQQLVGEIADVVVLAGRDERTFIVVAASDGGADEIVESVTDEFGGGGGGNGGFAQGGGIEAPPTTVIGFLE